MKLEQSMFHPQDPASPALLHGQKKQEQKEAKSSGVEEFVSSPSWPAPPRQNDVDAPHQLF